ncbi:MAG: hypothetical protein QOI20_3357, partial [Acidimicrobiaceae bacterium]|nr:hypothetical protein [Acidimicrobiaceae bacterium]
MPTFPSAARAFLAVTAILALPLASAVPQTVLTSTTASWDGTASGTLAGASHWWPNSTTPTPAESFFDLHGAEVRAEWDTAALYLDASPAFLLPAQPSHGGATYTNAALQGASSGPDRALYVFPLEGQALQVATSCAAAQASTQD